MAAGTLSKDLSTLTLIAHPSYTRCHLLAHPLTVGFAQVFQDLRVEGTQVLEQELQIREQIIAAQARIDRAAVTLDVVAGKVSKEILILTDDSVTAGLYVTYFGDKPIGKFCRPKLGRQKTSMGVWADSLEQSVHPTLVALAPAVRAAIDEVDAAIKARDTARLAMREFRNVGMKRQWVDQMNGRRKEVYGQLARLPHDNPTLPADFADHFFLKASIRYEGDEQEEPETAEEIEARLAEIAAEAEALRARRAEIDAKQLAAKQAAEARARKAAELAEVQKTAAALAERQAALKAELEADEA